MNNSHQYNPSWNPNWFLSVILDNHIDAMVARYSCLLTLRLDFFYKKDTPHYLHQDHHALERDLRLLMNKMMQKAAVVGYFWVIEWTVDHGFHAHAAYWLDGHQTQRSYPFALQAGELWKELTQQEGYFNICQFKEPYKADINIPVRYNEPTSILNIRRVLSYLTKEEQKEGLCSYGCNEVPHRPMSGRPRKAMGTISVN